ncbi:MAG: SMI1/KNR4 family protein [Anaerolineae bacterium]|nr:SMI1/KNR4 family protein [Anaerolineae bacterium]
MNGSNLVCVERILQKLAQVRARGLSCFGAENHGFQLNPPASEATLQDFEKAHHIRLPDDYRAFLAHAGNGGAGPYYGIYSLAGWNDFAGLVLDEIPDNFLALPCPLHPEMPQTENWADGLGDVSPYQGTLTLGTQGCTYAMLLIVSGPSSGRVVYVDADGGAPYLVHHPDFLSWYERWLDELLLGYASLWFGYGPGGGEDDFFRILDDPQADDDFKVEAMQAFCRLPNLSESASRRILEFQKHPLAGIRAGALAVVRTFKIHNTAEQTTMALGDPSPNVRRQAIYGAVMGLDPARWTEAVLQRLHEDPDEDVAEAAFFKLKEAKALSKRELLSIIEQSPSGKLRYLAAYEVKWDREDLSLLVRMLSDSHAMVRFYAMIGLRQIKARGTLPQILDLLSREHDNLVIGSILKMFGELHDPSTAPVLLKWAVSNDDFHRLDAVEALALIGDERAVPIAQAMLQEDRPPQRHEDGRSTQSNLHTIATLVSKALKASPNPALRKLAH